MKNKKIIQSEDKRRHRQSIKAVKEKRRLQPQTQRKAPNREELPVILIVCEGENTEPSYFNQFKLSTAKVEALGDGNNTISLVEQAIKLKKDGGYQEVWCVMDKDDFPANNFNNAINKALANGLNIVYSNQAFEYWLILHFEAHQGGGMPRKDYNDKINGYLNPMGLSYDGKNSKIIDEDFFDVLLAKEEEEESSRIDLAIKRAEKIDSELIHQNPALQESSTTVFKLVKRLLDFTA